MIIISCRENDDKDEGNSYRYICTEQQIDL
jgi:hypothetical protein